MPMAMTPRQIFLDVQTFTIEVTQTSNTEAVMAAIADWLASVFTER